MKIELYMDKESDWRWRLVASNGNMIVDSCEGYSNKSNCRRAIKKFKWSVLVAKLNLV